jgi:hypothetical protein
VPRWSESQHRRDTWRGCRPMTLCNRHPFPNWEDHNEECLRLDTRLPLYFQFFSPGLWSRPWILGCFHKAIFLFFLLKVRPIFPPISAFFQSGATAAEQAWFCSFWRFHQWNKSTSIRPAGVA